MNVQKLQLLEALIDSNRQRANWDGLRENVAKYRRKYYTAGSALEYLVLAEISLNSVSGWTAKQQVPYDQGPDLVHVPSPSVSPQMVDEAIKLLDKAMAASSTNPSATDLQTIWANQAAVLRGRIDIALGKTHEGIQRLLLAEFPDQLPPGAGTYARTMAVMRRVVLGWAYTMTGKEEAARDAFCAAGNFIASIIPLSDLDVSPLQTKIHEQEPDQWVVWAEDALYLQSMALIRANQVEDARRALRLYIQLVSNTPSTFEIAKRIAVFRHHIMYLFESLPEWTVFSGVASTFDLSPSRSNPPAHIVSVYADLHRVLPQYEKLLTTLTPFPRGEDSSMLAQDRYKRLMEAYDWIVKAEVLYARRPDEQLGDVIERHYRLIETLYRATKHTFQSMRILRYIAHSFLGLLLMHGDNIGPDERKEAECAVSTYVFYWDKKSSLVLDAKRKEMEDAVSRAATNSERPDALDRQLTRLVLREEKRAQAGPIHGPHEASVPSGVKIVAAGSDGQGVSPPSPTRQRITDAITSAVSPNTTPLGLLGINGEQSLHTNSVMPSDISTGYDPSVVHDRQRTNRSGQSAENADDDEAYPTSDSPVFTSEQANALQSRAFLTSVEGESPSDAIGVLLTGMRILLLTHGGNRNKLELAAEYGIKAYHLATAHLAHLPNYNLVLKNVYQWLGVVFGEQAQEMISSKEGRALQADSVDMFQKAAALGHSDYLLYYQLALQLAEVGEFTDAIDAIRKSIDLNGLYPNAYNLLALMLSSKGQHLRGLQIIREGWLYCITEFAKAQLIKIGDAAHGKDLESLITWDAVPMDVREDLMNLRLTQVALEHARYGARISLDTLLGMFTMLRRVLGLPPSFDDRKRSDSSEPRRKSLDVNSGSNEPRPLAHSGSAISLSHNAANGNARSLSQSPVPKSSSSATHLPASAHRFRMHDLLISLWLTTSAVYRELDLFDDAREATEEAERLVDALAKIEERIDLSPSRLFRDPVLGTSTSHMSLASAHTTNLGPTNRARMSKSKVRRVPSGDVRGHAHKWGFANRNVRRVLADLAFEQNMIQFSIFKAQARKPVVDKYNNYLSPVAKVEAERQSQQRKNTRMPLARSNASIASTMSNSTTNVTNTANDRSSSEDVSFENGVMGVLTSYDDLASTGRHSFVPMSPTSPSQPMTLPANGELKPGQPQSQGQAKSQPAIPPYMLLPRVQIDQIIASAQQITILDPDHLPSRVHLGILYLEKGDLVLAEHWLERACSQSKFRGAGGGRSGLSSIYGGATGVWGWLAWNKLASVFRETGRRSDAKQAIFFAMDLQKMHCVRGYECLPRYLTGGTGAW
ncbi:hypothetical protein BC831DRAFT_66731 [Entophlyctis helioformis]|nr:hypothetical protein BC831DRAFT_66731 [Entophlyctis helioformis]